MPLLPERQEETNFWPVYSDVAMVMVLLLLLFVLIQFVVNSKTLIQEAESLANAQYVTSQRDADQRLVVQLTLELEAAKRYSRELEERLKTLQQEIVQQGHIIQRLREQDVRAIQVKEELSKRQTAIAAVVQGERGVEGMRADGNLQTFTFSADTLFAPDEATLSLPGEDLLQRFVQVLQQHPEYYTRIEVEGHTDEKRSSRFYDKDKDDKDDHGNWRLSAERAITVVQLFQKRGISGQRLGVVGRSLYDPVATERTREALAQNRRVQVRLFYSEVTP